MKKFLLRFLLSLISTFLVPTVFLAQTPGPVAPKLVVGIVVDQMRYDFIQRFWGKFGNDGFKRLVNEGFSCKNTCYNYMPTYTGPGHASIFTGTTPAYHGIIANNWYDRTTGKSVYCAEDKTVQSLGTSSDAGKMSSRRMLSTSIADELRLSNNMKSKVIGIALKDRGGILPAGHTANAAYWYDNGNWISSSFYMKALPEWVDDFNKKGLAKQYLSKAWTTLLPIEQYTESLADDNPYEGTFKGEAKPVFPHNLPELMQNNGESELIRITPFGNSLTKEFAIEAIKAESLGKDEFTDLLALSFSSTDYVGHRFGIRAIELEDTYLRLDRDLAAFFKFLDTEVGKNDYLVFLTADHAAIDVAAYLADNRIPTGYFAEYPMLDALKGFLKQAYGDTLILAYDNQQLFLDHGSILQKNLDLEQIRQKTADFVLNYPGIATVFTADRLKTTEFSEAVPLAVQKGHHPKRSGDVMLVFEPGWVDYGKTGTTHGSPYRYDTHVPLLWYGWNIKKGSSHDQVYITDIAPTLAALLGISYPSACTGKPITAIVK